MTRGWLPWRRRAASPSGLVCREVVALVTDYLEGALPADERERFEAHIATCEHCSAYLEQLRDTLALLGELTPEALDPEMERDLLAAFREWKGSEA